MRSKPCGVLLHAVVVFVMVAAIASPSYGGCKFNKFNRLYSLTDLLHQYGDPAFGENDTLLADHPTFTAAFELWLTPGVSAALDDSDIEYIINTIADEDTTDLTDDHYPIVWNYFCHEDQDPSYPGLEYTIGTNTYTKIRIWLYDPEDLNLDPNTLTVISPDTCYYGDEGWAVCSGYSTGGGNTLMLSVCGDDPSLNHLLGQGFAHELQHICYEANGAVATWTGGTGANEALSTLAEHMVHNYRWSVEVPYDASVYQGEQCDMNLKYVVWKAWMSYLYDVFPGPSGDIEDDAVYQWIRYPGDSPFDYEISMQSLADVLWQTDFDFLGGEDSADRFQIAFADFAVAKFANAPSFDANGIFGYDVINSQSYLRFFDDVWSSFGTAGFDCPANQPASPPTLATGAGWNARVLPHTYTLDGSDEDTTTTVSGVYTDADGSSDYIDVAIYGTDYIIFSAGSYYDDSDQHDFTFSLSGTFSGTTNGRLRAWVIAYDVANGVNQHGGSTLPASASDILFIEPLGVAVDGGEYTAAAVVSDFGRLVKSVVIAIAPVENYLQAGMGGTPPYLFTYSYDYGVYSHTPGKTTPWQGDVFVKSDVTIPSGATLQVAAGTNVHVHETDWLYTATGRVHFAIHGTLDINGQTNNEVTFAPWDGTSWWDGIYSYSGSTVEVDWALVQTASYGINAYATTSTIKNSTFADCSTGLEFRNQAGSTSLEYCQLADNNTGLTAQDTATVTAELSTFTGNTTGVVAFSGANIVLGKIVGSSTIGGDNRLLDNTLFHVLSLGDTVWAQNCWWGDDECPTTKFYGPVVCEPPLDEDPYGGGGGGGGTGEKFPHPKEGFISRPDDDRTPAPAAFALVNVYPNPFNPDVTVEYSVASEGGHVRVGVYNVRGQLVATLVDQHRPGGLYTARWSAVDQHGRAAPSGVYFVRMVAPGFEGTRKIVLLK